MKIISTLLGLSTVVDRAEDRTWLQWLRDPLAHPDLEVMSKRELADLAFSRAPSPGPTLSAAHCN
jgi:hypothetical protein